eukprot:scaffold9605_cov139-Skeletonema_dohrnii-CCMP3373.AAC.1
MCTIYLLSTLFLLNGGVAAASSQSYIAAAIMILRVEASRSAGDSNWSFAPSDFDALPQRRLETSSI